VRWAERHFTGGRGVVFDDLVAGAFAAIAVAGAVLAGCRAMKAEVLTIGDELLRGEIVDSNKAFLSDRLLSLDIETHYHASVRDVPADMIDAFRRAAERSDVVLVSGGLGPTRDDLTSESLAQAFGREMRLDEAALAGIRAFFAAAGREMTENNASQAWFPDGAEVLANPIGTAPGFMLDCARCGVLLHARRAARDDAHDGRAGAAARRGAPVRSGGVVRARLLRTFGMGESTLDAELADIARIGRRRARLPHLVPRQLPAPGRARGHRRAGRRAARPRVRRDPRAARRARLRRGRGDARAGGRAAAARAQARVAVAESCTGGLVAGKLTDVPGSSDYFVGGVVAYADAAKRELLGVPEALLAQHGAVSEPGRARDGRGRARALRRRPRVATTGISGPGRRQRGEAGRARAHRARRRAGHARDHFVFPLDRTRHRQLTAQVALDWIRRRLLGFALEGPTLMRAAASSTPGGAVRWRTCACSGRSRSAPRRARAQPRSPRRCASSPAAATCAGCARSRCT
jgi:nicotinamide-nucleotide amidase